MEEIEKKAAEIQAEIKAAKEAADLATIMYKDVETGQKATDEELKALKVEMEKKNQELEQKATDLNEALNKLNLQIQKSSNVEKDEFGYGFKSVIESAEFKTELNAVLSGGKERTKVFEVKDDPSSLITSQATNPVSRTVPSTQIWSFGYEPNKFLAAFNPVTIPQDKNRAMWFDGVYYDNVGYMTELTAITTGDGGSIDEKYREIAKIGAKLPFSTEVSTDMSYFLNWYKNEGTKSVLAKIDNLIYTGVGADGGAYTKNIYGMKTQGATAFSASTAALALAIPQANIADLIRACVTQIRIQGNGNYNPNIVFLHPANVAKLYMLKNNQADYITILPNGDMVVYGIHIAETARVAVTEMLVCDTQTLQLHQKGSLEMEVQRYPETDSYVMYLRWRGQVVVPTFAKLGNVYVSNIDTAIAAITGTAPTSNVLIVNTAAAPVITKDFTWTTTAVPTTTVAPTTTTGG